MTEAEKKKNKNKKKVAATAVKLEDEQVKEIEFVLAQVSWRRQHAQLSTLTDKFDCLLSV